MCALPFVFFPAKICVLNLIEELRGKRISQELQKQINGEESCSSGIEETVSDEVHNSIAITLLVAITVSSLLVDDLRVVFGVIGAFSEAITNFFLPGIFLFVTELKLRERGSKKQAGIGFLLMVFGVVYFSMSLYFIISKLTRANSNSE